MKTILVGSLRRHGGSLLARLFDGHPDLYSLPLERRFGHQPRDDSRLKGIKAHWPNIYHALKSRDIRRIESLIFLSQYQRVFLKDGFKLEPSTIRFDFDRMQERFRTALAECRSWSRRTIWAAEIESFYRSLNDGEYWSGPRRFVVNHCATAAFLPLEIFFQELPGSRFVYLFRSPLAYFASIKRAAANDRARGRESSWAVSAGDDDAAAEFWTERWVQGVRAAINAKLLSGERVICLRYEDLIDRPDSTMNGLASSIGIDFHPILVKPTLFGRPWSGNSSFGPLEGISDAPVGQWRECLSRREQEVILERAGHWMRFLGYGIASEIEGSVRRFDEYVGEMAGAFSWGNARAELAHLKRENSRLRYRVVEQSILKRFWRFARGDFRIRSIPIASRRRRRAWADSAVFRTRSESPSAAEEGRAGATERSFEPV